MVSQSEVKGDDEKECVPHVVILVDYLVGDSDRPLVDVTVFKYPRIGSHNGLKQGMIIPGESDTAIQTVLMTGAEGRQFLVAVFTRKLESLLQRFYGSIVVSNIYAHGGTVVQFFDVQSTMTEG